MGDKSTFLFACPSFIEGMARVMDLGSTLQIYNDSKTSEEADFKALKKDWEVVGEDILCAVNKYEQKQTNSKPQ